MPADDQRDPLDGWLQQEVRPLPPPPGTFELITRRARRRKLRRLAITVGSAAAVVAAAVIATPPLLSLHTTPSSPVAERNAGRQSSVPSGETQQPNGTATKYTPPTPSKSPAAPVPTAPVPPNFQPVSVTFVSTKSGWVIGQAGTPGKCANKSDPYICTSIARTSDAGRTWSGAPAPATTGPNGARGVSGIRFLDGTSGWAFGPELWATHDAGKTWAQVNTNGARVTDLETAGDRAFALWATCSGGSGTAFAADCTSYSLMTTTASGDTWKPVGTATTGLSSGGDPTSAVLAITSTTGYLLAPGGKLYTGPLDGPWQQVPTAAPCATGQAGANGLPTSALLALVDSTHLVVACPQPGGTQVYTSDDSGTTWTGQPAAAWSGLPSIGTPASLAATPDGALALATTSGLYMLPARGSQWKQASSGSVPDGGFSYVGMTSNNQGVALPADATRHEIWMTVDGGVTWAPRTPITPGS